MDSFDEHWYEEYFGPDYLLIDLHQNTAREVDFLREALCLEKGKRLLDVGCGYGRHLAPLLESGVDAWGCDLSEFMLCEAAKHIRAARRTLAPDARRGMPRGNRLICCDNRGLPFRRSFDCAINMFNSFGYFPDECDNFLMLAEIADVLRPGGLFLLDQVNRDFILRHLTHRDWF